MRAEGMAKCSRYKAENDRCPGDGSSAPFSLMTIWGLKGIGVENRKGATVVPLDWRCIISLRLE